MFFSMCLVLQLNSNLSLAVLGKPHNREDNFVKLTIIPTEYSYLFNLPYFIEYMKIVKIVYSFSTVKSSFLSLNVVVNEI